VSDFNNNLAEVRRRFRPAEMMLLAGSAMGRKIDPIGFVEQVRRDVAASSGVFPMMIQKYRLNAGYLVSKVQSTRAELMEVLLARLINSNSCFNSHPSPVLKASGGQPRERFVVGGPAPAAAPPVSA
jgi:hypothetical protein